MWRELVLTPEQKTPPSERLVTRLRTQRGNGGALFASFQYTPHPVLDWFIQTGRLTPPAFDFASGLVTHPVVRQVLSGLDIPEVLSEPLRVNGLDSFDLEASLMRELVEGGANSSFSLPRAEVRLLAGEFADAYASGHERGWTAFTEASWTPWFRDLAWDRSWLGLNPGRRRVWLLCATDGD